MDKHFKDWAIEQHENTNHMYDGKLPYSFHLGLVVDVATKYKNIWTELNLFPGNAFTYSIMYNACWGHDLIEDTRVTYNDIIAKLKAFGYYNNNDKIVAEIIFALTNNKGRNRNERANQAYYDLIRSTPGAVFIKMCDRLANVKYSSLVKSSMLKKYRDENQHFMVSLGLITEVNETEDQYTGIGLAFRTMIAELEELLG